MSTETYHTGCKPDAIVVWAAGWNIPGYLPDDPACHYITWEKAREYLDDELARAGDDFTCEDGDQSIVNMYADAGDKLSKATAGERFCERVGNYVWWIEEIVLPADHMLEDWQFAVTSGTTRLGYRDWVETRIAEGE